MKVATSLTVALVALATPGLTAADEKDPHNPNVVIILADDLGYGDLGCYGNTTVPTPNIDSLARNGILCTDSYVTAAVCSPSRAGLLTGRYQQRFGLEFNGTMELTKAQLEKGLPLTEVTLADHVKNQGYVTGMVGKWHLGMDPKFHPMKRGFDEFFGFLWGGTLYVDPSAADVKHFQWNPKITPWTARWQLDPIMRNKEAVEEKGYLTDAFAREAVAFIDKHQKKPFFLYVPFNAVHSPFQTTNKYYDRFAFIKDEKLRIHASMTSALDDAVGAILNKLRHAKLEKNTLVFFLSDNGAATYTGAGNNGPLRMGKVTYFEGGIRIPFLVQWPDRLSAGGTYSQPVSSLDILPTILTAIGAEIPTESDGVDLLPFLSGKNVSAPHDFLCWRAGPISAIRKGNWKLVKAGDKVVWLYDLAKDTGERDNVSMQNPDIVKELLRLLTDWDKQLKAPLWSGEGHEIEIDGMKIEIKT
jgi:arylsulfatase A-like enzyme